MMKFWSITLLFAHAITCLSAVNITVRFEAATVQRSNATFTYFGVEDFNSLKLGSHKTYQSNFGLGVESPITGTYSNLNIQKRDIYGGAGGIGFYPVARLKTPYKLTLREGGEKGVNYFGYWLSALDIGNQLEFHSNGKRIFEFSAKKVFELVQSRPEYYGNPTYDTPENKAEPYVFLNFFCNDCLIEEVHFMQTTGSGYETDNHTVGYFKDTSGEIVPTDGPSDQSTESTDQPITDPPSESTDQPTSNGATEKSSTSIGIIIGASAGALAVLGAAGGGAYYVFRPKSVPDLSAAQFDSNAHQDVFEREMQADADAFA